MEAIMFSIFIPLFILAQLSVCDKNKKMVNRMFGMITGVNLLFVAVKHILLVFSEPSSPNNCCQSNYGYLFTSRNLS